MSSSSQSIQPVLTRIGTPADTNVSTDLVNIDAKVDTVSTAVVTDIPADTNYLYTTALDGSEVADSIGDKVADILVKANESTVNMWFVDASVGSSGDGTSLSTAFKTITEAETARAAADYVLIVPGTYDEDTVVGGLVIAKNSGNFVTLGDSFESIIIINTNGAATDVVTVTGNSNNFYGITVGQAGINAWNVTGTSNSCNKCSGSNSGIGFKIGAAANKIYLNECRSSTCTTSVELANDFGYLLNLIIDSSTTGIKVLTGANLNSIKDCSAVECTTGYQFDNGSLLSSLINCCGDNTTNITDNSAGNLSVINFNTPSELTAGNSIQEDMSEVDTKIDTIDGIVDNLLATTPRIVSRAKATLPATTQTAYFTVTGRVMVTQIVGEVDTTAMDGTVTSIKLISNPTVGADVDLCAALVVTSDVVGTMYNITGTLGDAMIATTSGAFAAQASAVIVAAGTIDLHTTATDAGETKWTLHYIPLDVGSTVVTA